MSCPYICLVTLQDRAKGSTSCSGKLGFSLLPEGYKVQPKKPFYFSQPCISTNSIHKLLIFSKSGPCGKLDL